MLRRPVAVVQIVTALFLISAAGTQAAPARTTGTLALRGTLAIAGATASRRFGEKCAAGTGIYVECFDTTGTGTIRGLGRVSLRLLQFIDTAPAGCDSGSYRVLGSPARLSVAGKEQTRAATGEPPGSGSRCAVAEPRFGCEKARREGGQT